MLLQTSAYACLSPERRENRMTCMGVVLVGSTSLTIAKVMRTDLPSFMILALILSRFAEKVNDAPNTSKVSSICDVSSSTGLWVSIRSSSDFFFICFRSAVEPPNHDGSQDFFGVSEGSLDWRDMRILTNLPELFLPGLVGFDVGEGGPDSGDSAFAGLSFSGEPPFGVSRNWWPFDLRLARRVSLTFAFFGLGRPCVNLETPCDVRRPRLNEFLSPASDFALESLPLREGGALASGSSLIICCFLSMSIQ
mmetsp:Transcript_8275/g.34752  ORF Transcript_8275/g.34752 Transcript_8275/m.34752 type:complete len:251 (+) Transcript_8275:108-860(+)